MSLREIVALKACEIDSDSTKIPHTYTGIELIADLCSFLQEKGDIYPFIARWLQSCWQKLELGRGHTSKDAYCGGSPV